MGSFSVLLPKFRDAFLFIFSLSNASRSFGTKKKKKKSSTQFGLRHLCYNRTIFLYSIFHYINFFSLQIQIINIYSKYLKSFISILQISSFTNLVFSVIDANFSNKSAQSFTSAYFFI
jgi:hypothetical protein